MDVVNTERGVHRGSLGGKQRQFTDVPLPCRAGWLTPDAGVTCRCHISWARLPCLPDPDGCWGTSTSAVGQRPSGRLRLAYHLRRRLATACPRPLRWWWTQWRGCYGNTGPSACLLFPYIGGKRAWNGCWLPTGQPSSFALRSTLDLFADD